ncbi:DUF2637 domain-containing protein [Kitasatospora sp. NPDC059646]|uniref:DUF2637 domain-containing protein n=1 Tax=Kitasatospora sp. NPDC059646 TaxID=3346893 RepID=UPI003682ECBC
MTVTTPNEAGEAVPATAPADSVYLADQQKRAALRFTLADWAIAVLGAAVATAVSGIGLASSYNALEEKAAKPASEGGWEWAYPWMLPVGLDLSIFGFSLINLVLIRIGRPARWVKWVPRLGAGFTIWLNWAAAGNLGSRIGHAVLAGLWVVFAEIAAHVYAVQIDAVHGRVRMERARPSRWFMAPITTFQVVRLMLLWEIPSYEEALALFKEREIYRQLMTQRYGKKWRKTAPTEALMPVKLARLGLTIEQALGIPADTADAEALREHEAGVRARELALRLEREKADAELAAVERQAAIDTAKAEAEARRLRAEAELAAAREEARTVADAVLRRHELALQVEAAKVTAENERLLAEAKAEAERVAAQAAFEADEIRRKAENAQLTAEIERQRLERQAAEEARAAEQERRRKEQEEAAEAARAAAVREAELADLRRRQEQAAAAADEAARKAAEDRRKAAEAAEREAVSKANAVVTEAEAERKAAEERRLAAEAAAVAAKLEEEMAAALEAASVAAASARRSPIEREALTVASMIEQFGEEKVTISYLMDKLKLTHGTAQDRRERAREILAARAAGGELGQAA